MTKSTATILANIRQTAGGCWAWTAAIDSHGYGSLRHQGRTQKAHRVSYELLVGPIADELVIDHLCRNRACVNPMHLEPVTERVNILRGESFAAKFAAATHCIHGHAFDDENTQIRPDGSRCCLTCRRARNRRYKRQARARRRATVS